MRWGYVHFPRFPLQRRVRETPSLAGKPMVLVEEAQGLRNVMCVSASAWRVGVRPEMTLTAGCAIEPSLVWMPHCLPDEQKALASLGEMLLSVAPAFQSCAPDGLWLDASAAKLFGGEESWAWKVLEVCRAHGYRGHMVVASTLLTSQALARHGRHRVEVILPGKEPESLAPLPLLALPSREVRLAMESLGLSTLGELCALPAQAVVARWGREGLWAQRFSRGEETLVFVADKPAETLSENIALDWPAETIEPLLFALKTVLGRLCARLVARALAAIRMSVRLGLDPRGDAQVELVLARPTADERLLLDLLRHRLSELSLQNPIASVHVCVEEHGPARAQQRVLGDEPAGDAALEVVLSRLSTTLGKEALFAAEVRSVHRPEAAYAQEAFRPPRAEKFMTARVSAKETHATFLRPSRVLSCPKELTVRMGGTGKICGAHWEGKELRATAVFGPERLKGEWWVSSGFERDYFRVHLEGVGPIWLYRDLLDGRFYLQGFFD